MHENRLIVVDGREYITNGCTCVPDGDWGEACDRHDVRYSIGGGPIARLRADILLGWEIWKIGRSKGWVGTFTHAFIGLAYFVGVLCMGWAFWCWWWKCDPGVQKPETKPIDLGPSNNSTVTQPPPDSPPSE